MCYKARVKKCGGCGLKCLTSGIRLRSPDGIGEAALFCRAEIVPYLYLTKKYPPHDNGGLLLLLG